MDDRFFAQHRARHRGCQRAAGRGGGVGDQHSVGRPRGAIAVCDDPRVARSFLIASHRAPSQVPERVEPVQGEQRQRGEIGEQIVSAVVREFVCQRQVPRMTVGLGHEPARQRNELVDHAERQRRFGGGALHQPHRPVLADGNGVN
jgi:hypothetical protein